VLIESACGFASAPAMRPAPAIGRFCLALVLDELVRRYQDLAKRATEMRGYL
jgi:hypothetical protein